MNSVLTTQLMCRDVTLKCYQQRGFTPLHVAAKYGHTAVVKLLLEHESSTAPSIDSEGRNGLTSLHVATHYNKINVVLALLEANASTHRQAKVIISQAVV